MRNWIKPLIFLAIIAGIVIIIRLTGLSYYFSFENLLHSRDSLKAFVSGNYLLSVLAFIGIYIAAAGLSIPGATVLTLAGGFLFGTLLGALYVNIGATLGAFAAFLVSRYFLGEVIQQRYPDRLASFNSEIKQNGASYLLTLRFIPIFPFFLINLFAGITKIRWFTFFWTTAVGIIPGSLVYTYAGSNLAGLKSASGILSWPILSALLLLALFSILPAVIKKVFMKK